MHGLRREKAKGDRERRTKVNEKQYYNHMSILSMHGIMYCACTIIIHVALHPRLGPKSFFDSHEG